MTDKIKQIFRSNKLFITILFVIACLILPRLGTRDLLDWDECVFSQQAKEMIQTGNILTNQWNKTILFEKPPLTTWMVRSSYVLGINEFTARLPIFLVSIALLIIIYTFCVKYFSKEVGLLAILLLINTKFYVLYSTQVNSDVIFTFFTFLGLFAWVVSSKKSSASYLAGLFFGLAVMSKGLSIFPYLFALLVSIVFDYSREKINNYIKMIGVFFLVILPWHLYEYIMYGSNFIQVYIREHLIRRAQYPIDFHIEGRLFYIKGIIENFGPWLVTLAVMPILYLDNWQKYLSINSIQKELKTKKLIFSIILLTIIPLIALIQVKTRIWWYILPIFPFISILLAYNIDLLIKRVKLQSYLMYTFIFILLSTGGILLLKNEMDKQNDPTSKITKRNEVFKHIRSLKENDIYYLVWFPERQAKQTLPDNMHTSTTFVFGGNPCAVYYSDKKIHYIYTTEEFAKKIAENKKNIFIVENGDMWTTKDKQVNTIYSNSDYTVFQK